jgi:hypothetical protein
MTFCFGDMSWPKCRAFVAHLSGPRETHADKLLLGTRLSEVIQTIGEPDYTMRSADGFAWEYDVDADIPYTLRVTFEGKEFLIDKVETMVPPGWKIDESLTRDMMIIYQM